MRIITVVMGEPDTKTRNSETSTMLDYAFAQYKVEELINKKSVIAKKEVEKGKSKYVKIVPKEDIVLLTKKTDKIGKITYNLNLKKVKAPVKKGKVLGDIEVKRNGKIINKVNVTVKNDVKLRLTVHYKHRMILKGDFYVWKFYRRSKKSFSYGKKRNDKFKTSLCWK